MLVRVFVLAVDSAGDERNQFEREAANRGLNSDVWSSSG